MSQKRAQTIEACVTLSLLIQDLRHTRRWSISELSRRSGVSRSSIAQLEAGRLNVSLLTLQALANAFDAPLSVYVFPGNK